MPREITKHPDSTRRRTLGAIAIWWIESFVVHGPGPIMYEPVVTGPEYAGFLLDCYSLDTDGRRLHDSAFLSRPKGCDKSGISARIALFEALGPSRFDHWATADEPPYYYLGQPYFFREGEPVGKPVKNPRIRIMATVKDQAGLVYETILANFEEGPLAVLRGVGLDANQTRVTLPPPYGGTIVPSSSGGNSKDGGQETFVCFDETHLYTLPRLHNMYEKVTNNLVKRAQTDEGWFLETTTMFGPGEDSVAERTYEMVQQIREGNVIDPRILCDHRYGQIENDDIADRDLMLAALYDAYGDAASYMKPENTIRRIYNNRSPEARNAQRYFLNAISAQHDNSWFTAPQLDRVIYPRTREMLDTKTGQIYPIAPARELVPGEQITMGFDGSLSDDATALIGCCVSDGYIFPIHVEQLPDGPEADGWRVNQPLFDSFVQQMFATYEVVAFFADPPYWQPWLNKWEMEYGHRLRVNAGGKSKIAFWTSYPAQMGSAIDRLYTDVITGNAKLSNDHAMRRHFLNAVTEVRSGRTVITKVNPDSPLKIDIAVAAALAYEARGQFLFRGTPKTRTITRKPQQVGGRRAR